MKHYYAFLAVLLFSLIQTGASLNCYSCTSKLPNETCFTPINKKAISSVECKSTTPIRQLFGTENVGPTILRATETAVEFQCIQYKKFYTRDNTTEMTRGCFPKNDQMSGCAAINLTAQFDQFTVLNCDTCTSDNCNSTSGIKTNLLFCLLSFILWNLLR